MTALDKTRDGGRDWVTQHAVRSFNQGVRRQHMTQFQLVPLSLVSLCAIHSYADQGCRFRGGSIYLFFLKPNDNKVVRGGRVYRSERVVGAGFGRIGGRPRKCCARTGAAATVGTVSLRLVMTNLGVSGLPRWWGDIKLYFPVVLRCLRLIRGTAFTAPCPN